jgi:Zn-dependent peptidase ImmA (M78 family)/DNA-binding XRE family transcriptional regulator
MNITIKKRTTNFQPYRLTQARLAKGWTIVDLARQVDLTRQAIYSFEKGESNPSYETLKDLAKSLDAKESFFCLQIDPDGIKKESAFNFRSLKSTYSKNRDSAKTYLELFAELCHSLQKNYVTFPQTKLPEFDIGDFEKLTFDEIEEYASQTRNHFGLGNGPISNLTLLLENHGVHVGYLPLPEKIEGVSVWFNRRPYVLVNSRAYACRARLDLAHELGHLVLHRSVSQEDLEDKKLLDLIEKQAFYFGMAFLVPEKPLAQEFYSMDINALIDLKKRWGTAMQALVMRLSDLDMIGDSQKRYFFQRMQIDGMRKKEPLDDVIQREESITIKRVIELLDANEILSANDCLEEISLPGGLERALANLPDDFFKPKIQQNNVVKLRIAN